MAEKLGVGHILPLEVMDKCISRKMWVVMKDQREFYGTLAGFDEYMNMLMQDCKEYSVSFTKGQEDRTKVSEMDEMLLNGSHVCMMVPGDNAELNKN